MTYLRQIGLLLWLLFEEVKLQLVLITATTLFILKVTPMWLRLMWLRMKL